jgi:hypothetical protein
VTKVTLSEAGTRLLPSGPQPQTAICSEPLSYHLYSIPLANFFVLIAEMMVCIMSFSAVGL